MLAYADLLQLRIIAATAGMHSHLMDLFSWLKDPQYLLDMFRYLAKQIFPAKPSSTLA